MLIEFNRHDGAALRLNPRYVASVETRPAHWFGGPDSEELVCVVTMASGLQHRLIDRAQDVVARLREAEELGQ